MPENDPRVFFAAERTQLAWIRTALALIGLGFVVARFGMLVRLLDAPGAATAEHRVAPWVGMAFALLGAVAATVASVQHRRFCRTLGKSERPPGWRPEVALAIGFGVALAGFVLAALLAL